MLPLRRFGRVVEFLGRIRSNRRIQDVQIGLVGGHDVPDLETAQGQAVGDELPMASPRDRLGAHDGGRPMSGPLDEPLEGGADRGVAW